MVTEASRKNYYSFFSTFDGQTTVDPKQMMIPIDDHGFHRGDGVFEAVKWIGKKIWLLEPHLHRLQASCLRIGLSVPMDRTSLVKKIENLVSLANQEKGLIRIFVTRGPGSFGVSPYESIGPQMYIVTTELKEWTADRVQKGASLMKSSLVAKKGLFAQVKSLNYLPNVLMKKEAIDAGFDFSFGVSEAGEVLESSTENLGFIKGKKLVTPLFDSTLRGTSLIRLTELLTNRLDLNWEARIFTTEELIQADSIFLVGTTIDVLPVSRIENINIDPEPALKLRELLIADQR